jgi:hypothetical protein
MTFKKKLIEVALPLVAINKACKEDKDRKTGQYPQPTQMVCSYAFACLACSAVRVFG